MANPDRNITTRRLNVALGEGETELVNQMMDYTGMNIASLVRALVNSGAKRLGMEPAGPIPKYLTPTDQREMA